MVLRTNPTVELCVVATLLRCLTGVVATRFSFRKRGDIPYGLHVERRVCHDCEWKRTRQATGPRWLIVGHLPLKKIHAHLSVIVDDEQRLAIWRGLSCGAATQDASAT
jgi:hypothetical protein